MKRAKKTFTFAAEHQAAGRAGSKKRGEEDLGWGRVKAAGRLRAGEGGHAEKRTPELIGGDEKVFLDQNGGEKGKTGKEAFGGTNVPRASESRRSWGLIGYSTTLKISSRWNRGHLRRRETWERRGSCKKTLVEKGDRESRSGISRA